MNKTIACIYRACNREMDGNINVSRPPWFNKKKCWKSFYDTFGLKQNVDIYVVYDGEINEELWSYINQFKFHHITYLNDKSNEKSLLHCYEMAKDLNYDYIFFVEDDFLWLPNSYEILMEGLERFGKIGFVTLYGHLNRYLPPSITGDVTYGQDYILLTQSSFWRTEDSTTCTFALSKELFTNVKDSLISHSVSDCAFFREQLLKHHRRVVSPLPCMATHVNKIYCSPLRDWEKFNETIQL